MLTFGEDVQWIHLASHLQFSPSYRLAGGLSNSLDFLTQGEMAITVSSCFGAAIPGCLCPTFAYHFTVGDRWPTHLNPIKDLITDSFTSE
jgi:hypothetical protein